MRVILMAAFAMSLIAAAPSWCIASLASRCCTTTKAPSNGAISLRLHRGSGAIAATSDEEVGLIGPTSFGDPGSSLDRDLLFKT